MDQNAFIAQFPYYSATPQMARYQQANWIWPMLEKGNSSMRHKFTKAEDDLLKQLVLKYGETNWMAVAAQMKTRTPRQCRERYKNYLSDKIKNSWDSIFCVSVHH